jgi:DNA-binding NarL/FixJ family response regulator
MLRLMLVDDHPIVREGLKAFLSLQDDIEVVAEAASREAVLREAAAHKPDVILLDVELGDGQSLPLIPQLLAQSPKPKVMILSSFLDETLLRQALDAGASGYLLKHAGTRSLLDSIRAVSRGEVPLDPHAVTLLTRFQHSPLTELTAREQDVLRLIADGLSNRDIAERLNIAEKTVKTHVSNILSKLSLESRTQVALWARDKGL